MFKAIFRVVGAVVTAAPNLAESFVDSVFRDSVEPEVGSVVYCDMCMGMAEHSGIYIGNNEIIHFTSEGNIEKVTPNEFIEDTTAMNILVSCNDEEAVGSYTVARRAKGMLHETRDYNVIFNNCHQFSSGCLTGDFDNSDNFLWMLKDRSKENIDSNTWRNWDIDLTD